MVDRVLLVDDEPRVIDGIQRALNGRFSLVSATSGSQGLDLLAAAQGEADPIAVIVSDMMMPVMNGAAFLAAAQAIAPEAVRMILSGQADLVSTIAAVNSGNLFRFLTKPCSPDDLRVAIGAGLRQYQLVRTEKEVLEQTLGGSINVLTDVLALASPPAAHRTARIRTIVARVAEQLDLESDWRLPVAAMLSQLGCIAVPGPVLEKLDSGASLSDFELQMVLSHPETGRHLLERIPRLAEVAAWVGAQPADADGARSLRPGSGQGELAGSVLPAVAAFLLMVDSGESLKDAARSLAAAEFSSDLVAAVMAAVEEATPKSGKPATVGGEGLIPGMVLLEDLKTTTGMLLIRRGDVVTDVLAQRVTNFSRSVGVVEPIRVTIGAVANA